VRGDEAEYRVSKRVSEDVVHPIWLATDLLQWLHFGVAPMMARSSTASSAVQMTSIRRRLAGCRREGGCTCRAERGGRAVREIQGTSLDVYRAWPYSVESGDQEGACQRYTLKDKVEITRILAA
jgi:hypothetical protein